MAASCPLQLSAVSASLLTNNRCRIAQCAETSAVYNLLKHRITGHPSALCVPQSPPMIAFHWFFGWNHGLFIWFSCCSSALPLDGSQVCRAWLLARKCWLRSCDGKRRLFLELWAETGGCSESRIGESDIALLWWKRRLGKWLCGCSDTD